MNRPDTPSEERRCAARAKTERDVVFFHGGSANPRVGTVCDISLNGLGVLTGAPLPVGSGIELEIKPREDLPGSQAIFVRGTVARVVRHAGPDSRWLMGVHFEVAVHDPIPAPLTPDDAAALIRATRLDLLVRDPSRPDALAAGEYFRQERSAISAPVQVPERRRKRRRIVLIIFFLFGAASSAFWWWLHGGAGEPQLSGPTGVEKPDVAGPGGAVASVPTLESQLSSMIARMKGSSDTLAKPSGESGSSDRGVAEKVSKERGIEGTPDPLQEGFSLLEAGAWPEARAAFDRALTEANEPEIVRLQAQLGAAEAEWAESGPEAARARLDDSGFEDATAADIDPVWQQAATSLSAALGEHGGNLADHVFLASVELAPADDAQTPQPDSVARVEIDKSEFTLTVFLGDDALRKFPVGIGRDDSTPVGSFTIANKIVNPTWYNRGAPVVPGDPRNPLGSRWMGLGTDRGATPYGIHGTADPSSIGDAQSRGCIRMRPSDVEALFELCPLGTFVTIRP